MLQPDQNTLKYFRGNGEEVVLLLPDFIHRAPEMMLAHHGLRKAFGD